MALIDRGVMPNGTEADALLAIACRCPECLPLTADDLAPAQGGRFAPVRTTADLDAGLYGFLRGYAQARDVAAADVIRELIRQVRADPGPVGGSRPSWRGGRRRSPRRRGRLGSRSDPLKGVTAHRNGHLPGA